MSNILFDLFTGKLWTKIADAGKWVWAQFQTYQAGQKALNDAKLDLELAELKAKTETAAYKVKSELEWDLKWADAANNSWKDEYLLVFWSLPLIALFIPGPTRDAAVWWLDYLKNFSPDAPMWYLAGWSIIFAASFGMRQALAVMLPGRVAALATSLGSAPPDIPEDAIKAIDARLKK